MSTHSKRGGPLASIVIGLATFIALVMALHVLFTLVRTNENNGVVEAVAWLANTFAWGLNNIFILENESIELLVDYGTPALLYLVAARALAIPLRRLG